jgi:hypothetical protein
MTPLLGRLTVTGAVAVGVSTVIVPLPLKRMYCVPVSR